jgi:hypothetical protein
MDYKHVMEGGEWSLWRPVIFIRPTEYGWEIMGPNGCVWGDRSAMLRMTLVTNEG